MLPYVHVPALGPITIFGVLAFLGVTLAERAGYWHAKRLDLDKAAVRRMGVYCAIGGILGAHYFDLFLYQPGWSARPDALRVFFNPFSGISSFGGLIGGTLGFLLFARRRSGKRLRYADVALVGVVVLLLFGRAGCASVHDHVGIATRFPLAVDFPAGNPTGVVGPHHDLGLYELVLFGALLALTLVLLRVPRRPGWIVALVALCYSVPRFFLDFLRRPETDPRYAALTPAQWACIAAVAAALALFAWIYMRGDPVPPPRRYAS